MKMKRQRKGCPTKTKRIKERGEKRWGMKKTTSKTCYNEKLKNWIFVGTTFF